MKSSNINFSSRFKIVISLSQNKLILIFCLQLFFINNIFAQNYEIDDGSVNGQTIILAYVLVPSMTQEVVVVTTTTVKTLVLLFVRIMEELYL